jgi:glycosyltransferase involved in cell wall biosynthesis
VSPFRNVQALWRLWRLMRKNRPEIVHTHTAMAGCIGRLAAIFARVPVVVHTFHGNSLRGYFSPLFNRVFLRVERMLARFTDAICVLSPQQLQELSSEFGVAPASRFRVVPLGFDLSGFATLPLPLATGTRLKVGWLGRMVPVKDIPFLIRVIEATLSRTREVEFHIAGDGPDSYAVSAAAKRYPENVFWRGWQENVLPLIDQCDVLIQTSTNEGTPVALIQGMAAGRPFVSTRAGGVVDMVVESTLSANGRYANALLLNRDPDEFAESLNELRMDRIRLNEMGSRAREFALQQYSQSKLFDHLDSIYRELLSIAVPQKYATHQTTAGALE